jgi:hypothetical protein
VVVGQRHAPAAVPSGKSSGTSCRESWVGLSEQVRKISPPQGFDPRTVQFLASGYIDYVIPAHIKFYQFGDKKFLSTRYPFIWHTRAWLKDCLVSRWSSLFQSCKSTSLPNWKMSKRRNTNACLHQAGRQAVTLPYTWPNGHRLQDCEGGLVVWRRLQWATERHMHLHDSEQAAQFATSDEHQIHAGIHLLEIINQTRLHFKFTLITKRQNCLGDQSTQFITSTKCTVLINPYPANVENWVSS